MTSTRRIAITAGALFMLATAASLTASSVVPALTGVDYLTVVAAHPHQLAAAAVLYLVAAGGSVGIAIALYPVLREFSPGLALAAVVFRAIEAVFYTAGVVSLLSLQGVGQALLTAPPADRAAYRVLGDSLVAAREHAAVAAVLAFSVGAFTSYVVLYRSRLVPRWLSGWGLAGACLILIACMLALVNNRAVTGYVALAAPIGVQEIVFAGWLLIKGFGPSARSGSTTDQNTTTATRTGALER